MNLIGRKIVDVRHMTETEKDDEYWEYRAPVLVLDDGTLLYPSSDDEGNDAGALFIKDKTGQYGIGVER